jgi:hypothetical protein
MKCCKKKTETERETERQRQRENGGMSTNIQELSKARVGTI